MEDPYADVPRKCILCTHKVDLDYKVCTFVCASQHIINKLVIRLDSSTAVYTCECLVCQCRLYTVTMCSVFHNDKLKLKLKTNLYSAIKSGDSEALDGVTSQRGSQRRCGEIKIF